MPQIRDLLGDTATRHGHVELAWEEGEIAVRFPNGRSQAIRYEMVGDMVRFKTTILKPAAARDIGVERLAEDLLDRNHETPVVAFGFSSRGHVEAWVDQRMATMQADELKFYVVTLAAEADRLEYLFTGRDVH